MPEDPPGAPTVDGGGSAGDIPMGVDEGCGPTSNYSSKITLTPKTAHSSLAPFLAASAQMDHF